MKEACDSRSSSFPPALPSETMMKLVRLARAPSACVLILGEHSTGRRHFARALHAATFSEGKLLSVGADDFSARIEQLCAPENLRSDRLTGGGTTIYVPEIATTAAREQRALLGVLEALQRVRASARVVASSNAPLADAVRAGRLDAHLARYFRETVRTLPLRERREGIPAFARLFAASVAARLELPEPSLTANALAVLEQHSWPGNFAELRAAIERATVLAEGRPIDARDLTALEPSPGTAEIRLPEGGIDLARVERHFIEQALAQANQNQTRAAAMIGLTRDQLRYRMAKFELQVERS